MTTQPHLNELCNIPEDELPPGSLLVIWDSAGILDKDRLAGVSPWKMWTSAQLDEKFGEPCSPIDVKHPTRAMTLSALAQQSSETQAFYEQSQNSAPSIMWNCLSTIFCVTDEQGRIRITKRRHGIVG